MPRFAGDGLDQKGVSNGITILNFSALLEKRQLCQRLFAGVEGHLADE